MSGNSVQLIRISNGVKNAGLNFLNGENFKRILTDVETGLDKLGKYVNGPDFNNDLNNFAENVAKVVKALSGFVGFAVEHPRLLGPQYLLDHRELVLWQPQRPELPPVLLVEVFLGLQPEQ